MSIAAPDRKASKPLPPPIVRRACAYFEALLPSYRELNIAGMGLPATSRARTIEMSHHGASSIPRRVSGADALPFAGGE